MARSPSTALVFIVSLLFTFPAAGQEITLKSLIGELADLSRLSRFPSPPYVTRQSSSYDRASTSPANQEAWFANGDSGHFVKVESRGGRKEFVLLEAEGPGVMVRLWYARPGAKDNIAPPGPEALVIPVLPERKTFAIAGAIEGEELAQIEKTGGVADGQEMSPFEGQWSRDHHLWWREARPGDRLVLGFDAPKAGKYRLIARLTKALDYGIHQLKVNGRKAGDPVDLWNDGVIPFELELGTFDLEAKGNRLEVEITGTNDKARPKNYMFGLDCLTLQER